MKSALVLGGTRFFGKQLVKRLQHGGYDVTVASRRPPVDDSVRHVSFDRTKPETFSGLQPSQGNWDLVFDQICYNATQASQLLDELEDKMEFYVMTSTMSVYDGGSSLVEEDFVALESGKYESSNDYQKGKRDAEHVVATRLKDRYSAARIPIVLGKDDYTNRFQFHIDHIRDGVGIYFPNSRIRMSFIHSEDAGDFIFTLGNNRISGPVNGCNAGTIAMKDLMLEIADQLGTTCKYLDAKDEENHSPYGATSDWVLDTGRAEQLGFKFRELLPVVRSLISDSIQ